MGTLGHYIWGRGLRCRVFGLLGFGVSRASEFLRGSGIFRACVNPEPWTSICCAIVGCLVALCAIRAPRRVKRCQGLDSEAVGLLRRKFPDTTLKAHPLHPRSHRKRP